jgi:hypothetical protein
MKMGLDIQSKNEPQWISNYHEVDPLGDDEKDLQQSDLHYDC